MCKFLRRLYKPEYLETYNRKGTNVEKSNSKLVTELGKIASVFKTSNKSEIALVPAAQSYGRTYVEEIRYSVFGGISTIDKEQVSLGYTLEWC